MASERRPTPKKIKAPHGAMVFELEWSDGTSTVIPHVILRGYCPCATCQGHSGSIEYKPGGSLELRDIRRVGNYALALGWGDGHDAGIYSFEYLRDLGKRVEVEGIEKLTQVPLPSEPT